jgi:hypothetical protein
MGGGGPGGRGGNSLRSPEFLSFDSGGLFELALFCWPKSVNREIL